MWRNICSEYCDGKSLDCLRNAVLLWIHRPHLVNRRLAGTEELHRSPLVSGESGNKNDCLEFLTGLGFSSQLLQSCLQEFSDNCEVLVRCLIPRSSRYCDALEIVIFDFENNQAAFFPATGSVHNDHENGGCCEDLQSEPKSPSVALPYRLLWRTSDVNQYEISVDCWEDMEFPEPAVKSRRWLAAELLPKLAKWAGSASVEFLEEQKLQERSSLRLVDVREYTKIHQRLKEKYYRKIVDGWTESTDPKKFVSEDIGIAAYLLALWQDDCDGNHKQSFVDLGCGNGLLVYLLNQEGHRGIGVDVRRRKTWVQFGVDGGALIERTFNPSEETVPDVDWVIGNHSDELTPWIPWVAARSSYRTKFFLLPCCAFDFDRKFCKPGNEAEYSSYLKYVNYLGTELGFAMERDTLRIPSTKRTCFVGRRRTYDTEMDGMMEQRRQEFLRSRTNPSRSSFVVRPATESTNNCSHFDPNLKADIAAKVADLLLNSDCLIELPEKKQWRSGKEMRIDEVASLLDPGILERMKSQCGGLQTFLRNHQHIFSVNRGIVKLRNYQEPPVKRSPKSSKAARTPKSKSCWFFEHHPDGCILDDSLCFYVHKR